MSGWFALVALLAAINPPRLRPYFDVRKRPLQTLAATVVTFGACALLVVSAESILGALEITAETWHIGAGVVALLVGARVLVSPRIGDLEVPGGWWAAVAPLAFPLLFTPQLAVLTVLLGTGSKATAIGWLTVALAATFGVATVSHQRPVLWLGAARFLGAVLVVVAVALVVAGIRDV